MNSNKNASAQAVVFIRARRDRTESRDATFEQNVAWQRAECRNLADKMGLTIIREYIDEGGGVSLERRPVLREMLAELHALHDTAYVITTDETRLTRNARDLQYIQLQLDIAGARLVLAKYAEMSPVAQEAMTLLTTTIAAWAEQDRRARRRSRKPAIAGPQPKGAAV